MQSSIRPPVVARIATDALILILAFSTLAWWLVYLLGGSFDVFLLVAPISIVLTALFLAAQGLFSETESSPPSEPLPIASRQMALAGASALVGVAALEIPNQWVFWCGAALALALLVYATRNESHPSSHIEEVYDPLTVPALLVLGLAAIAVTLIAHRPDADDNLYLSQAIGLLDKPDTPLREIPGYMNGRALASHQALAATLAKLFDTSLLSSYYLVTPAIFAFLSVFVFFRFFHAFGVGSPLACTAAMLVILVAWGDVHRSPGNFAYVRLFQGKAIVSTLVAPMMMVYAAEVFTRRKIWSGVLLACALTAAIGMSQTLLLTGLLFLLMFLPLLWPRTLSALRSAAPMSSLLSSFVRDGGRLSFALIPLLLAACVLIIVRQGPPPPSEAVTSTQVIGYTVGFDFRGLLGFAALFLFPVLVAPSLRKAMAWSVALMIIIGLNPLTGQIFNKINATASWRVTWLIPFAAATAAMICYVSGEFGKAAKIGKIGTGLAMSLLLIVYAVLGQTTLSTSNQTSITKPQPKIPDQGSMTLKLYGKKIPGTRGKREPRPIVDGRMCLDETRCY